MSPPNEVGPRDTTPGDTDTTTPAAIKTSTASDLNGAGVRRNPPLLTPKDDFVASLEMRDAAEHAPIDWTGDAEANTRLLREYQAGQATRRAGRAGGQCTANGVGPRAQKALESEFYTLSTTPSGSRNHQLNTSAFNLGQIVGAGFLPEAVAEQQLTLACHANGLANDGMRSVEATLRSGLEAGKAQPRVWEADEPYGAQVIEMNASEFSTTTGESGDDKRTRPPEPPLYADRLLTRSDLHALPKPQPLIDNVLDRGTTALLYGKWGTAKSFIGLDWGLSVAAGRNWQGRAVHQCRALYVAGEGAFGFKGRVDAWETGWHTKISDTDFALLPFPVNLTRPLEVANLAALIAWGGYSFVIIDTLARCMVGADENSAKDCGVAVDAMTRLLASTPGGRGVVLGAHHAGKDGETMRGSSAFESGADTVYFSRRDGAVIVLDREKRKDGPELDHHELKIDPIPGTASAVISVHRGGGQTDRGERLLSTFVHHFAATGASKAELRLVAELAPATFHRALSDLVKTGALINTGTDKRPFYVKPSE